jgi:hypothetical protein
VHQGLHRIFREGLDKIHTTGLYFSSSCVDAILLDSPFDTFQAASKIADRFSSKFVPEDLRPVLSSSPTSVFDAFWLPSVSVGYTTSHRTPPFYLAHSPWSVSPFELWISFSAFLARLNSSHANGASVPILPDSPSLERPKSGLFQRITQLVKRIAFGYRE